MNKTASIQFVNIHKSYHNNLVLENLNLAVSPGEHVVMIGPSGSGKSTILRLLMTLEKPDSGEILIEGESLWHTTRGGRTAGSSSSHGGGGDRSGRDRKERRACWRGRPP